MYQWKDGTIGYFLTSGKFLNLPSCGGIKLAGQLQMFHCHPPKSHLMICEKDGTQGKVFSNENDVIKIRELTFSPALNHSTHFAHVVCPYGHWTHTFMSCDAQSACWHSDNIKANSRSADICLSPRSSLFSCKNHVEHVPYSLVCDHSQDCLDSSDEDFCVHPPCSGSLLLECSNRQVGALWIAKRFIGVTVNLKEPDT